MQGQYSLGNVTARTTVHRRIISHEHTVDDHCADNEHAEDCGQGGLRHRHCRSDTLPLWWGSLSELLPCCMYLFPVRASSGQVSAVPTSREGSLPDSSLLLGRATDPSAELVDIDLTGPRLGMLQLSWKSVYPACTKPWPQTPALHEQGMAAHTCDPSTKELSAVSIHSSTSSPGHRESELAWAT
jgi:hypothetical protein